MIRCFKSGKHPQIVPFVLFGILFFAINYYFFNFLKMRSGTIIWSDAEGYYQYLPYYFLQHDITHMGYAVRLDNGLMFDKFTYGTALMELPFFGLAYLYNITFGFINDGYTSVYAMFIWVAASFYAYLGLFFLYKILRKWFDKLPSFIAVICVYFGTNLFFTPL